jgi:hypothetical protein
MDATVLHRSSGRRTAPPYFTPAPTKGMNTVANIAAMDPMYALSLQNMICEPDGCTVRTGTRSWATGFATEVTSLLPYISESANADKLFAVAGGSIFDITSGGAIGAAEVSGLSAASPYWECAMQTFSTSGTNYLFACNGTDAPRIYDGSTWTTCTQVAVPAGPGQFLTGTVSINDIVDVVLHQQRLWFVVANSTKGYYIDIAAIGGELQPFDFGPFFANGGSLHKLASWTVDSGGSAGSQALLCAISNQGDIAVYQGDDPSSATTFALIGTYKVGAPVGRRCTAKRGGDVLVMSQQGLFAMSTLLQSTRVNVNQTISYNISPTISSLAATLEGLDGFEVVNYADADLVLLNIPQADQDNNFQFVLHTISGGWSQFTGWPARCFGQLNGSLYFGAGDTVQLAFIGYKDAADIDGAGGNTVISTGLQAYDQMVSLGLQGLRKHVKQLQPMLTTGDSAPVIRMGVNTDYDLVPIVGAATLNPITGAVWNNALWNDPGATWVGSLTTSNRWVTVRSYPGVSHAIAISISASAETKWVGTTWMFVPGNIYG